MQYKLVVDGNKLGSWSACGQIYRPGEYTVGEDVAKAAKNINGLRVTPISVPGVDQADAGMSSQPRAATRGRPRKEPGN